MCYISDNKYFPDMCNTNIFATLEESRSPGYVTHIAIFCLRDIPEADPDHRECCGGWGIIGNRVSVPDNHPHTRVKSLCLCQTLMNLTKNDDR